jgi:hypothetical protein
MKRPVRTIAVCCVITLAACAHAARYAPPAGDADAGITGRSAAGVGPSGVAGRTPVLVELFTSEGCSSCPPADALLARLDKTQPVEGVEVIPLALHVDYWNHLGWRDPFSSPEFSARQGEYSRAFGKDDVYTPQMVIDGRAEFNGSNEARAHDSVAKAALEPKAGVRVTRADGPDVPDGLRLSVSVSGLPKLSEGDTAQVLLAVTESGLSMSVPRGENAGLRLGHVGVVRRLSAVGDAAAGPPFRAEPAVAFDGGWRRENLRVVVFVQERASRRVLGAAVYRPGG